jgi:hypothetical protein
MELDLCIILVIQTHLTWYILSSSIQLWNMDLYAGSTKKKKKKYLLIMKEGCENYEMDLLIYFLHGAESFLRS